MAAASLSPNLTGGLRVRPRFEETVPLTLASAEARIRASFQRAPDLFELKVMPEFIVVHLTDPLRRRWSPRLQLSLEAVDPDQTRIVGVYGPEHEVWATFLFGYMMTGLLAVFSGIYGAVQVFLGDEPWALWITGGVLVIAGVLYLLAQLGQKLGAWQTFQLHQTYRRAFAAPPEESGIEAGSHI